MPERLRRVGGRLKVNQESAGTKKSFEVHQEAAFSFFFLFKKKKKKRIKCRETTETKACGLLMKACLVAF